MDQAGGEFMGKRPVYWNRSFKRHPVGCWHSSVWWLPTTWPLEDHPYIGQDIVKERDQQVRIPPRKEQVEDQKCVNTVEMFFGYQCSCYRISELLHGEPKISLRNEAIIWFFLICSKGFIYLKRMKLYFIYVGCIPIIPAFWKENMVKLLFTIIIKICHENISKMVFTIFHGIIYHRRRRW